MNKRENAIEKQFAQTELQLGTYSLVWESSEPFKKIVDRWRLVREDMERNVIIHQINIHGLREFKLALQRSMADLSFKSWNAIQTYAKTQDPQDIILFNKVNIQPRDLNHGNEQGCVKSARIIEQTAREMIDDLGSYGLVIGDVDNYLESINKFEEAIPMVDDGIMLKKIATAAVKAAVKKEELY